MSIIRELNECRISAWNMPHTCQITEGYDQKTIPQPTAENMQYMLERLNVLIGIVEEMAEKTLREGE